MALAVERTVISQLGTGQAGPAWTHLVSVQQAAISRTANIARRSGQTLGIGNVSLVNSCRDHVAIPGMSATTSSIALVTRAALAIGHSQTFTAHLAKSGKSWRYMLSASEFSRCSNGPTPTS